MRFVSLNYGAVSESTSEPTPTREVTADAFVAARPCASNPCQALDCGDCALQAAFLCVFARFCACRESNMGKKSFKSIQIYHRRCLWWLQAKIIC